jgi:hypothetical protein
MPGQAVSIDKTILPVGKGIPEAMHPDLTAER